MLRRIIVSMFLLAFVSGLAACGETWKGMKEDTSRNLHKAGDAAE